MPVSDGAPFILLGDAMVVAVVWIEELIREAEQSVDEDEVFFVEGESVAAN
jgi:hypothetical protein